MMAGTLFIVATPIGNLKDITLRALRILKEVDLIAAEDTRHTQKLLGHYGIRTPLTSYHEHNERAKAGALIDRLLGGENIALVADAGTPAISDPGYRLVVEAVRHALAVVPVPGPSALTAALSASGLPTDRFAFEGFLPEKKRQRESRLQALRGESRTLVFYEAPHRLCDFLSDIERILGDRDVAIGRELTKIHEEFLRGTASAVRDRLGERQVKGELVIIVRGAAERPSIAYDELKRLIDRLLAGGSGVKEIAAMINRSHGLAKREIYRLALEVKSLRERRAKGPSGG